MKRFATMALAAATLIAPLAAPTVAAADPPRHRDHDGDRYRDRDRDHDGRWDDRSDRRNYREGRRDQRRWDRGQHNGYSYNGRWYYGPPPAAYYGRYEPGYRSWRRGDRLPSYYRNSYAEVDWRRHHLRAPPRGYHWVRDDRGEYLLVALTTGIILGAILSNNY